LLYADTVELFSPAAVLISNVAALEQSDGDTWLALFEQLDDGTLSHLGMDVEARQALAAFRALNRLPQEQQRRVLGPSYHEMRRLSADFESTLNASGGPRDLVADLLERAHAPELNDALAAGVLTLSTDFFTANAHTSIQVAEYTEQLKALLARPGAHLLLDEMMSGLAESLIGEGQVVPSGVTLGRVVRAQVGTGLVSRLPAFPNASVTTILEARAELAEPLLVYRRGVQRLSQSVRSEPFGVELPHEIDDMWRDEVVPAVESLRQDLSRTRLVHDAAVAVGRDVKAAMAGAALFFGIDNFTEIHSVTAGLAAGVPVAAKVATDAYSGGAERRRAAKGHDLFYLLELEGRL
jgi:hypothetical protein